MPKLNCDCGYIHNLSLIPDDGFIILKDQDYEQLIEFESNLKDADPDKQIDDIELNNLQDHIIAQINSINERLYRCPNCNLLIWLRQDGTVERFKYLN